MASTSRSEALVERARQELGRAELLADGVVVVVGGLLRRAARQGRRAPERHSRATCAWAFRERGSNARQRCARPGADPNDGLPDLQVVHRDALAVEHPEDIVVGLDEELGRIGKRLVAGKPCRLGMAVGADDGQICYFLVEILGDSARSRLGREQAIGIDQYGIHLTPHESATSLGARGQTTSIHTSLPPDQPREVHRFLNPDAEEW